MDFADENFMNKMARRSIVGAVIVFIFSICFRLYDVSFLIGSFYYSLFASMAGGLQIVIAFDYYNDGVENRSFGFITLYLIGLILGVIIFYFVILNIPMEITSILKIEAVR